MVTESGGISPPCLIRQGPRARHGQRLCDDCYGHRDLFDARRCRRCGHVFTTDALGIGDDIVTIFTKRARA